jgi:hypothetical protein
MESHIRLLQEAPYGQPWLCGAVLPVTKRMHQFLDRAKWRDHIHKHIGKDLGDSKPPICPHPRPQCAEAFESVQELRFHLQDVHCLEFTRDLNGLNRRTKWRLSLAKSIELVIPIVTAQTWRPTHFLNKNINLWTKRRNCGAKRQ